MLQFYFLSVLLALITGVILVYEKSFLAQDKDTILLDMTEDKEEKDSENIFNNKMFRLVIGALCIVAGIMKMFCPMGERHIVFFGDFFIMLANIVGGFCLIFEYYSEHSSAEGIEVSLPQILLNIVTSGRKYVGIYCLASGVLHFMLPTILFL